MSTIAVSDVRQRVAAAVEALTSPAAWTESPWPWDLFPLDPGIWAHLSFAVGAPSTAFEDPAESFRGHRSAAGGRVETRVGIRWTYRLQGDALVSSYDAALDAEQTLLLALTATSLRNGADGPMHVYARSTTRRIVGEGVWVFGEVDLAVKHQRAIQ